MAGIDFSDDPLLGADPLASALAGRLPVRGTAAARGLQAARDFEGILLHRLVEAMRQTVPEDGLFSSPAGRQMEGLFWFYLAQEMGRRGGIGLWKDLARKLDLAGGDAPRPPAEGPQA
jgi:Rod binding domain-containing protein